MVNQFLKVEITGALVKEELSDYRIGSIFLVIPLKGAIVE